MKHTVNKLEAVPVMLQFGQWIYDYILMLQSTDSRCPSSDTRTY